MAKAAYDHRQAIDHISFDAGGVLVYLDDVRMSELLSELCGRPITPAECMEAERHAMASTKKFNDELIDGIPQWAHEYFNNLATYAFHGVNAKQSSRFSEYLDRFFAMNVGGILYSKIGQDVPEALRRLKNHGFRLSVTSDASGQVARNLKKQGLDRYFEFILDSGVEGVSKPKLYDTLIERSGVPTNRILHVDNNEKLVRKALDYGLQAILYDPQDVCASPKELSRFRNLLDMTDMLTGQQS